MRHSGPLIEEQRMLLKAFLCGQCVFALHTPGFGVTLVKHSGRMSWLPGQTKTNLRGPLECDRQEDNPITFQVLAPFLDIALYLEVFGGAGQNGASLLPDETLVVFKHPQHGLIVVHVPQQHPKVTLGFAPQLVGEDQAEGPRVGRHHRAEESGSLLLRLQAGVHVQIAVEL